MVWLGVLRAAAIIVAGQTLLVALAAALVARANIYKIAIAVICVTAPIAALADGLVAGQTLDLEGRLFLVLLHFGLGGLLVHFLTLPDRSVTLRILVELQLTPDRTLSIAELNQRYGVNHMIDARVNQLADGGFLSMAADGGLTLTSRGESFGRFVAGGRRLFRIESAN
jgi:hypothetical protein